METVLRNLSKHTGENLNLQSAKLYGKTALIQNT